MKIKIGMLCFCLLLAGSLGFLFLHAQNDSEFRMAPLNPAFLKMNEETRAGTFYMNPKFGYVPGPVDHSLFKAIAPPSAAGSFPASYDLRTYNKVNPIRDQGQCGACWAFSNMGSIESSLLPTESRNFAEQHLNKYHGFDNAECQGGGSNMAAAYFARWDGPYNETDYPYPYSSTGSWPGAGSAAVQKHVQRVVWLPNDKDTIKAFLTSSSYGAVSFAFFADGRIAYNDNSSDAYYNAANYAYYYPAAHDTDHEIDIIGWDDNFAKTKFSTTPTNNGAWLCRNSWGTSYHNAGYFWMSYEDKTINDLAVYSSVQPADNYKNIYQYDQFGHCTDWGGSSATLWGANIFTATTNDPLKAISYYTTDACNVNYYIYKNPTATNPTSGTLAASGTASFSYPAYLTTDLSAPVSLAAGNRFSVVIKFVNNSYKNPIAVEAKFQNYSSGATNAAGQSFYSTDGSAWMDLYTYSSNTYSLNCCIKAFTGTTGNTLTIQASSGGTTDPVPGTYTYPSGTDVPIRALPDQSCVFLGWAGDASGTANPITIHVDGNKNVTANFKLVSPPSNLTAVRLTNRSVTQTEYIVTLSWNANTANAGLNIVAYRVYQVVGDSWVYIGDLPANTLACWIRRLPKGAQTFGVASVNEGGVESARSTVVK
ncbi:MAG: lectin like domain-containing protein [Candidatus Aminicenantales bacterium]